MDSRTSRTLPTASPSGWLMSVTTAAASRPSARVVSTSRRARCEAASRVFMNAPLPHLTS